MRNNLVESVMGAIVLLIAGSFLYFVYSSQGVSSTGYIVTARFDRIDGLNIGSDVKISGVKVGTVHDMEIDPQTYQAKVGLQIKRGLNLPGDSSAEIVSESLMGGKYVALVPGGGTEMIPENGMIPYTQSSVNLESLISKFLFSGNTSKQDTSKNEGAK
ncbi:MAG: outer membrane lipid asymmetry maintenance protein MlaD [Alphaproteobacteria bacterium]|nr:outer membrane lipid asymmetry maintenance protein MlaD [Alphaproteobacteria bacterium]